MDKCDDLVEIPTFGLKNSLNVASACPIGVYLNPTQTTNTNLNH